MSKLSRRETLAGGGKVMAAAAVLPFLPSVLTGVADRANGVQQAISRGSSFIRCFV